MRTSCLPVYYLQTLFVLFSWLASSSTTTLGALVPTVSIHSTKLETLVVNEAQEKKPRTWNKPYYGTPSEQCRRDTGAGIIQGDYPAQNFKFTDSSLAIVASKYLTKSESPATEDAGLSFEQNVGIRRRQPHQLPEISNHILAAYHFVCPQGGRMSQVFFWGVVYVEGTENVQMIAWHNILSFTDTYLLRRTGRWVSSWDSLWCVPHDKLECWYLGRGHTQGILDELRRTISIGLVGMNPLQVRIPTVEEFCDEIGHGMRRVNGVSCLIEHIQAYGNA